MKKATKKRAPVQQYVSPNQLIIPGFETPFTQKLDSKNRWVVLSQNIPWDALSDVYSKQMSSSKEGRPSLSSRVVIGAVMIKHINNWSDEETILQIQENMYLQYFLGYSSFIINPIFDASLFVEIRKRLGEKQVSELNELIVKKYLEKSTVKQTEEQDDKSDQAPPPSHYGKMITDATACPQDIAYPTDLNLLNDARVKSEWLIDRLYATGTKPRTYRQMARKDYLKVAKNKNKSKNLIRSSVREQLNYVKRNLGHIIKRLQDANSEPIIITEKEEKYLHVITKLYEQQQQMYDNKTHTIENRIVSIHQPHVRPILRGKANAKTEFGSKISVTIANGFTFLDDLSWDAFNEGKRLLAYVNKYKDRFGYYPQEILADSIYCNRENRKLLKDLDIKLVAKPLGRPNKMAVKEYVRPGERNPIEGVFGQAKVAYGLGRIKARLEHTSQSWIASIIMVLNLVKLARLETYAQIKTLLNQLFYKLKYQIIDFFKQKDDLLDLAF